MNVFGCVFLCIVCLVVGIILGWVFDKDNGWVVVKMDKIYLKYLTEHLESEIRTNREYEQLTSPSFYVVALIKYHFFKNYQRLEK